MAISHADHDHPNTPAARAKCRRANDAGGTTHLSYVNLAKIVEPAKIAVVPRRRGDGGVVKGMIDANPNLTTPKATNRRLKVSGTLIKAERDLGDVPAVLAPAIRSAWKMAWDVQAGHPFNESERRVVITGTHAEIALVWSEDGRTGVFVRRHDSSITNRVDTLEIAFTEAGA